MPATSFVLEGLEQISTPFFNRLETHRLICHPYLLQQKWLGGVYETNLLGPK